MCCLKEREQEQEQEKQVQARRDQQIEIEKFVDREYSRNEERPTSWPLSMLAKRASESEHPFYPLSEFKLGHCKSLAFPDQMLVSRNYFNPDWRGLRRIKNVVVVMEWTADSQELRLEDLSDVAAPLTQEQEDALEEAHTLLSAAVGGGLFNRLALSKAVRAVTDMDPAEEMIDEIIACYAKECNQGGMTVDVTIEQTLDVSALRKLLQVCMTSLGARISPIVHRATGCIRRV